MLTVSTELQPILNGIVQFISYMVLAVFAENVILARALGVTRLMKLVPDHRAQVWDFCLPLLLVITLSAPAGWAAHDLFFPCCVIICPHGCPFRPAAIVYLTCGIAAMAVAWLLLGVLPRKLRASCRSQLSLATCSTAVLGTMLICANQTIRFCKASRSLWAAGWAMSLPSLSFGRAAAVCAARPSPRSSRVCPAR